MCVLTRVWVFPVASPKINDSGSEGAPLCTQYAACYGGSVILTCDILTVVSVENAIMMIYGQDYFFSL